MAIGLAILAGAAEGALIDLAQQFYNGGDGCWSIDYGSIGRSAAIGGITGGALGAAAPIFARGISAIGKQFTKGLNKGLGGSKRVGRHMSPAEASKMKATGRVQESRNGMTRVADPANPLTYKAAPKGDSYYEFDVPANRVIPHSEGTGQIPGPNSINARVPGANPADFAMPPATNIKGPL